MFPQNRLFASLLTCLSFAAVTAQADTLYFANSFNYVYNGSLTDYSDFAPNALTATASGSTGGITLSGSANLSTGTLKMSNDGDVSSASGVDAAAEATMGDTITAFGSTGGLNLGATINIDGSVTDLNSSNNNTFLVVDILPTGSFDQTNYFSDILWSAAYALGSNSSPTQGWQTYASSLTGSYGNGSYTIPLNIPFNTIGNNFQIYVGLFSFEAGSSPDTWTTDYSDTMTVSLSAPNGVTLESDSGLPGTILASPEPGTIGLMLAGLAVIAAAGRRSICR